jgi:8-oxo-dGTP pyrophosphatase MutT (NUDIX family)
MSADSLSELLTEEKIQKLMIAQEPNQAAFPSPAPGMRRAAVLIPLLKNGSDWHILYTKRSTTVNTHKGQVSFPGGSVEPQDRSIRDTALREAYEEIGLLPGNVRTLGLFKDFVTISDFVITPVVGKIIGWPFPIIPMDAEVERVFTIPVSWLSEPSNWKEEERQLPDGRYEKVIYYRLFDNELLWGITARITNAFLKHLRLIP